MLPGVTLPPYLDGLQLIGLPSFTYHRKYLQFCFIVGILNGSISSILVLCRFYFNASQINLEIVCQFEDILADQTMVTTVQLIS